ncbi:hypothetical protein I3F58_05285 [Streptomyces sp. MUM 203J]|uniref:hypothetical protein n=1 Tax=Streptomyces sp. MUM 203J TaxID=2791990 RepID=UPI001F04D8C7|nr:hypothetical protein [Streptomyces sp. MUM 203J]MCH0538977.1 hypothetical protein [Streptomyces sp. MUM 203J]
MGAVAGKLRCLPVLLGLVGLVVVGTGLFSGALSERDLGCGAPCAGAPTAPGAAARYDDGLEVRVSAARRTERGSTVEMTVTLRGTGSEPTAHGSLRIWSSDPDKSMSLPMDRQDDRVARPLAPGDTVRVTYRVRVEKVADGGRIRVFVRPGDRYVQAEWYVPLPVS